HLNIDNASIREKLAPASFYSATYRLFKLPTLEAACEDYGQAVVYRGGIPHHEAQIVLDKHHVIEKGKVFPVCGNTWLMLHDTRFKPYFEFIGNTDKHYGIFAGCGTPIPFDNNADNNLACC
ncbi:methyltransferase type 11, partial [bacterium]|nr:methyltransferase type 11 [bacterium]